MSSDASAGASAGDDLSVPAHIKNLRDTCPVCLTILMSPCGHFICAECYDNLTENKAKCDNI